MAGSSSTASTLSWHQLSGKEDQDTLIKQSAPRMRYCNKAVTLDGLTTTAMLDLALHVSIELIQTFLQEYM